MTPGYMNFFKSDQARYNQDDAILSCDWLRFCRETPLRPDRFLYKESCLALSKQMLERLLAHCA